MKKTVGVLILASLLLLGSASVYAGPWPVPGTGEVNTPATTTDLN